MSTVDDMAVRRLLLAAVRTRFSPQIQELKEDAIDGIVERILMAAEKGKYCSPGSVQKIFSRTAGFHIALNDIKSSLERSFAQSRVEKAPKEVSGEKLRVKGKQKETYKLNDAVRAEIEDYEKTSLRRFDAVVNRLFKDSERDSALYSEPFLKLLSVVFFRLAGESVRSLLGESGEEDVVSSPIFQSAMDSVRGDLRSINAAVLENGVTNFFRNSDPEYAAIKWNLAQSYHSLRAIGLHEGGVILGGELFKNAEFYLDTNLVISALMPEEEHHTGFIALCKACNKLAETMKRYNASIMVVLILVLVLLVACTGTIRVSPAEEQSTQELEAYLESSSPILKQHVETTETTNQANRAFVTAVSSRSESEILETLRDYVDTLAWGLKRTDSDLLDYKKLTPPPEARTYHSLMIEILIKEQTALGDTLSYYSSVLRYGTGDAITLDRANQLFLEAQKLNLQAQYELRDLLERLEH